MYVSQQAALLLFALCQVKQGTVTSKKKNNNNKIKLNENRRKKANYDLGILCPQFCFY